MVHELESVKRIFLEDVQEKKMAGRNVYGTSRGASAKRYPFEMLTGKQKKDYIRNGKVQVYNMYENILPYDQFLAIESLEKRAEILQSWRDRFSNAQIERTWGIKTHQYYKVVKDHGLKTATPGNSKARQQSIGAAVQPTVKSGRGAAIAQFPTEGLGISYAGVFSVTSLEEKFSKIVGFLTGEGGAFSVNISVFEDIAPEQSQDGIKINYAGTFSGEELLARFDKISGFLKDEPGKFNVRILVQEEAA